MYYRQKENKQRLDMIVKSVSDLQNLNTKLQTLHNNCKYQDKLPEAAKNSLQLVQQLVMAADSVCAECQRTGEATQDKVDRIKKILEQAKNAYEFVKQEIGEWVLFVALFLLISMLSVLWQTVGFHSQRCSGEDATGA